jgi:hypothetical protein
MALVAVNRTRYGGGPNRSFSGVTTIAGGYGRTLGIAGSLLNFPVGTAAVTSQTDRSSVPVGSLHPISWVLPRKSGGMASRTRRIVGSGAVSNAGLVGGLSAAATVSGSGDINNAAMGLVAAMVAALSGSGNVSSADMRGILSALASLSGSGDITASLGAQAGLIAALTGDGNVSGAILRAQGSMSANITVTGTGLNSANVADAILDSPAGVEQSITVREALRLILAASAGKVAGAETTTVTIRNVGDTKTRITATVDANGNRTAVTTDLT